MAFFRVMLLVLLGFSPLAFAQSVTLQGTYVSMIEDHPTHVKTRHFVRTPYGRVEISSPPTNLQTGQWVQIHGQWRATSSLVEPLGHGGMSALFLPASTLTHTLGQQNTAVILVRFQDDVTVPQKNAIETLVFGAQNSVHEFMKRSSFEQTWLAGTVFDAVQVPYNRNTCPDMMLLTQAADNALQQQGHALQSYTKRIYVFPKNACSWTGLALVGEQPGLAWINGSYTLKAFAHEFGHMLGLRHAHALDCDTSPTGSTCTNLPYGDATDIMGNVRTGDYSAYMKERLGWLGDGVSPDILTASTSGRYSIDSYSSLSVGPKALRIPRGTNAQGQTLYLYVEKRSHENNDAVLQGVGNLTQGVLVRQVTHGEGDSIYQLDMTPNSAVGSTADLSDGALAVNATYLDPMSGISMTVMRADSQGAVMDVLYPGTTPPPTPTCTPQSPSITVSPSSKTMTLGSSTTYVLDIRNQDDAANLACRAQTFAVTYSLPTGFSGGLNPVTVTVLPGQTGRVELQVKATTALVGHYTLNMSAVANDGRQATTQATLTLIRDCPQAPRFRVRFVPGRSGLLFDVWMENPNDLRCLGSGTNESLPKNDVGVGVPVSPPVIAPTPAVSTRPTHKPRRVKQGRVVSHQAF